MMTWRSVIERDGGNIFLYSDCAGIWLTGSEETHTNAVLFIARADQDSNM
jgi:hypothetical protein